MKREIRKLNLTDAFLVSAIINKLGIELDTDKMLDEYSKYDNEDDAAIAIGGKYLAEIFKNFGKAQDEIFAWLVEFSEDLTLEEVKYIPLLEIKDMVKEKFSGEDIEGFFQIALADRHEVEDLLLKRYSDMGYILKLDVSHVCKLIKYAREQEAEERMWQTYLTVYPYMEKPEGYQVWLDRYKKEVAMIEAKRVQDYRIKTMSKEEMLRDLKGGKA